jgi:predicted dehydrogenase
VELLLGVGVIGLGSAGARHARNLAEGRVNGARLAAVCDPLQERQREFAVPGFADAGALLASASVDAVVIATPHRLHVPLGRAALASGRHVLVEKPLGVHRAECDELLAEHRALDEGRPVFGVVHDYRVDPRYAWLKELLAAGEFGRVERVVWQATDLYRTLAYYHSSAWRGRFATEGGGLLLNQAPHLLDTLVWLLGAPKRVFGLCRFGQFHDIEVEDDVTAAIDFASGVRAVLIAGTGEAPGTNRLEISCDRGRIVLEGHEALVQRNREPASAHRRRERSGKPLSDVERITLPKAERTRVEVLTNFVAAIRGEARLLVPASEAVRAVEVANAILWSSIEGRALDLPLDGAGFARLLDRLVAEGEERPGFAAVVR